MDRASLAARIQDILNRRRGAAGVAPAARLRGEDEDAAFAGRCTAAESSARVLEVLGATLADSEHGPCVVVDREYPASYRHGRHPVEGLAGAARDGVPSLPWFLDGKAGVQCADSEPSRLLFFDLETTGLSGGAGTVAFLVGWGFFDGDAFRTRQFFLRGYSAERALLHAAALFAASFGVGAGVVGPGAILVTYNGRAFDLPLIETRYAFHRLACPFTGAPHLDMLFPARRLWKRRAEWAPLSAPAWSGGHDASGSCALTALERDILELRRQDDVPGWEIPSRYFAFARTGDAACVSAVLEHNRLDLLSLAAVTGLVLQMARRGVGAARDRHECLALGRLFELLARPEDAECCYLAAASDEPGPGAEGDRLARAEALRWIAVQRRRTRRFDEAADAWRRLAAIDGIDPELCREALEALAIHHEHRVRDLPTAREFALRALDLAEDARRVNEVRHRLGRLSRKLDGPGRDRGPGDP